MGDVLIALIPAFIVSVIVYGVDALVVTGYPSPPASHSNI